MHGRNTFSFVKQKCFPGNNKMAKWKRDGEGVLVTHLNTLLIEKSKHKKKGFGWISMGFWGVVLVFLLFVKWDLLYTLFRWWLGEPRSSSIPSRSSISNNHYHYQKTNKNRVNPLSSSVILNINRTNNANKYFWLFHNKTGNEIFE